MPHTRSPLEPHVACKCVWLLLHVTLMLWLGLQLCAKKKSLQPKAGKQAANKNGAAKKPDASAAPQANATPAAGTAAPKEEIKENKPDGPAADKSGSRKNKAKDANQQKQEKPNAEDKQNGKNEKEGGSRKEAEEKDPEPDGPETSRTQVSKTLRVGHDDDTIKHIQSLKEDKNKSE